MDNLTPLLIDAKEEYLGQVTDVLAPFVLTAFRDMYADASKNKGKVLLTFQRALREIPGWNAHVVRQKTQDIEVRFQSLGKLIAALFVSVVKIMSSIRLSRDRQPNIRLKLPSNDAFVHQVYIQTAREFYNTPTLINENRAVRINTVREGVRAAVREMLPIDEILTAYLGGSVDGEGTMSPLPDDDAWPAPPPPPAPSAATTAGPVVDDTPASLAAAVGDDKDDDKDDDARSESSEAAEEDTKEIDLNKNGDGTASVVVPSTQADPDSEQPKKDKPKELFSDAEDGDF
jgi:hypothetical protein